MRQKKLKLTPVWPPPHLALPPLAELEEIHRKALAGVASVPEPRPIDPGPMVKALRRARAERQPSAGGVVCD